MLDTVEGQAEVSLVGGVEHVIVLVEGPRQSKHVQGVLFDSHIIVNPANTREWIVLLKKGVGTSFFLVDDQEQVESFADLNSLIEELRLLGIKGAEIHL